MTTITHRQLAISAAARYETNEDLQLPLPDGGTVPWSPSVAFAVLGHMSQHWTGLARPITVESGRPGAGSAVLRMDGTELVPTTHRLAAGTRADNGLPYVRELCGHISCPRTAPAGPAGPGSRCPDHTTDPVPAADLPPTGVNWPRLRGRKPTRLVARRHESPTTSGGA